MVLTKTQQKQLNTSILQYLCNNDYAKTAELFAAETELSLTDVDPQGNTLQMKWKAVTKLQAKINTLQEKNKSLQEDLAKLSKGGSVATNANINDLYILKTPAKFQLKGHQSNITSISFHPSFTQIATSAEDGTVKIWDFQTGEYFKTLKGHTNPVNCVNFDSEGNFLVSSSSDLTIKLWDANNDFQNIKTFNGHDHNVSYVNFLGTDYLISCSRDRTIKLWQISTGYCKRTFKGHEGWVKHLVYSTDLKTFVSCSEDQSIIVWNIDKQAPVNRFFAHEHVIETLALVEGEKSTILMNSDFLKHKFTQQNKITALKQLQQTGVNGIEKYHQTLIISGARDKLIRLWSCPAGQLLFTFIGHDNWVRSLALHPTGKYLYSASDDKTIRIWDLHFGKEKKKIQAHEHFISTIRFNAKYGVIATAGTDKILKIWHLK